MLIKACLFASVALGCVACGPPSGPAAVAAPHGPPVVVGKAAPELHAEKISGAGPITVAEARGRVIVVDFWATYCTPCKKSFPRYEELVRRHAKDVAVIAVSVDKAEDGATREQVAEFGKQAGVTFAVVWDKDGAAVGAYGPPKMPSSYIIDRAGVLRGIHAGYEDGEEERIQAEVERLLASP